jgi:hypothetical protein
MATFITLTTVTLEQAEGSRIHLNVDHIISIAPCLIVGKPDGSTITTSFKDATRVIESPDHVIALIQGEQS